MQVKIIKADGTAEAFDPAKLQTSLIRAGAQQGDAETIGHEIEKELREGMTTSEIYSHAFARLRERRHVAAARYSLKRALLEFGPSGFPFEAYIGELFTAEGYTTKIDQIIQGKCVDHEVDVVIEKDNRIIYAEAKFHNSAGFKTDLKVVLYVKARIDDIGKGEGLVVTNTKFTSKAVEYATCAGLELLGWDYPQGHSLHERIDKAGLYPVTALTTLSNREKMALLNERLVLCKALPNNTDALSRAGVHGEKADAVLFEVGALCTVGKDI